MTRTTDNPALARDFLRFMMTEPFQSAIPERNWMYPATPIEGGLPASFAGLERPEKSLFMPPDTVSANRRQWVDEWLQAMGR
jgi:thiamine transport system substrate-binding protein